MNINFLIRRKRKRGLRARRKNIQIVGASGTVTSQNLPAIGKAANGFVTGVGYSPLLDSPENKKFIADFQAAAKTQPDLYGADS